MVARSLLMVTFGAHGSCAGWLSWSTYGSTALPVVVLVNQGEGG